MIRARPSPPRGPGAVFLSLLSLLAAAFAAGASPIHAQQATEPVLAASSAPSAGPREAPADGEPRRWFNAWTVKSEEDRLIWGMSTVHLYKIHEGVSFDPTTVALVHDGFYGATFRTTHGPRGYSLGIERSWLSGSSGPFGGMIGFRGGLVYGYDHRLGWMAEKYPILPFVQPVLYGRIGRLTTDLTYTWVVMSLTAGLRF